MFATPIFSLGGGGGDCPPPPPRRLWFAMIQWKIPKYRLLDFVLLFLIRHIQQYIQNSTWKSAKYVTYGTAKKKRPGYLVGNLVATNWPIEKALHAIGYTKFQTK